MKTRYMIKKVWMAALPLALMTAACQNEEIIEDVQTPAAEGTTVLRAVMGSYDTPQSRAQVELGNADESQEIFMWNDGDSFTLYDKSAGYAPSVFTISGYSEENPSAEATFIGEGELAQDAEVTAVYPAQEANAASGTVTLTMPEITMTDGSDEDWKNYMRQSMFMYADTIMDGANTSLIFKHLCAMARISYTNATQDDLAISTVALNSDANLNCFGKILAFDLQKHTGQVSNTLPSVSLGFSGLTVPSGRTVDFYLLFFPNSNAETAVSVSIGGNKSSSVILSEGFEAGKRYWFNVVQSQTGDLIWKKDIEEGVIANLPLIRMAEEQNGLTFERDDNGFVNVADNQEKINQVTTLFLSFDEAVDNLDGLENFTKVKELYVSGLGLQTLDVSSLKDLTCLECAENKLQTLDVSENTNLVTLSCVDNQLTSLNVGSNDSLEVLLCGDNQLVELDVTKLPQLKQLTLSTVSWSSLEPCNLVSSLDVTQNPNLEELEVSNCPNLTSLDVSQNLKLKKLYCSCTAVKIDPSNNEMLEELYCGDLYVQIDKLDVSKLKNLVRLDCAYCGITSLDVSQNDQLEYLRAFSHDITELDFSRNLKLQELMCGGSSLKSLNITENNALESLYVTYSPITSLDLSEKVNLIQLECYGCQLSELDITHNPNLQWIYCGNQQDAGSNPIPLTLYLTAEQQPMWEDVQWEWNNENVTAVVQ